MRKREEILKRRDVISFLIDCRNSFKFFCEELLKYTTTGQEIKIQPFQERWVYLAERHQRLVVEAATDLAKTETLCVLYPLWCMFRTENLRILAVAASKDQAKGNILDRIKLYIRENEMLRDLFIPSDAESTWNASEIKTKQNHWIRVVPYSHRARSYRANLILFDEFDTVEDVNLYFEDIVSRLFSGGKIILTSTPKTFKGILYELKDRAKKGNLLGYHFEKTQVLVKKDGSPAYTCPPENVTYDMLKDCVSIWEERHPTKEVLAKWFEQQKWNFMKNQMCEMIGDSEDSIFPFKYIINSIDYNLDFNETLHSDAIYCIAADFATSEGARADYTFLTVVEKRDSKYTVKYAEWYQGKDDEYTKRVIENLYQKYENGNGTMVIADSSNAGKLFIKKINSIGIPVVEQKFSQAERNTLLRTLSTILMGNLLVIPKNYEDKSAEYCDLLKEQLTGFVRAKSDKTFAEIYKSTAPHDDGAISLAMAVSELTKYDMMDVESPLLGN